VRHEKALADLDVLRWGTSCRFVHSGGSLARLEESSTETGVRAPREGRVEGGCTADVWKTKRDADYHIMAELLWDYEELGPSKGVVSSEFVYTIPHFYLGERITIDFDSNDRVIGKHCAN